MHQRLGKRGEEIAARHLQALGYTIIHRNWRKGHLEIDLIARDQKDIVFVEVKTRTSAIHGPPETAVNWKKRMHMGTAADHYMKQQKTKLQARFDILSIISHQGKTQIMHFKDAFWPGVF